MSAESSLMTLDDPIGQRTADLNWTSHQNIHVVLLQPVSAAAMLHANVLWKCWGDWFVNESFI